MIKDILISLFLLPQTIIKYCLIYPLYIVNLLLTHPLELLSFKKYNPDKPDKLLVLVACHNHLKDIEKGKIYPMILAWLTFLPLIVITFPINTFHVIIAYKQGKTILSTKRQEFQFDPQKYTVSSFIWPLKDENFLTKMNGELFAYDHSISNLWQIFTDKTPKPTHILNAQYFK
jgi:hypothetical protein